MLTQRTAIEKVKRFAREVQNTGLHLRKVILYGSYARNKQHQWSDIDIALVADEFTGIGFNDADYFVSINNKKQFIIIEARTFPTSYFRKGDPFIDEIKRTGIEIKI
ncbi:MAG TPA: nucleotidyltransferase domain-containing protein [Bacteroidia bacterium]|nr:nucleotidyltransferase domain-containing protein [Bacteroidia bacterium]